MINQIAVNISIITACIPSLRRVVTDLMSHQTGLRLSQNLELTVGGSGGSQGFKCAIMPTEISTQSQSGSNSRKSIPYGHNKDNERIGNIAAVSAGGTRSLSLVHESSEEHLRPDAIHYTIEATVEEDERASLPSGTRPEL
jgi:hypothetical protein